MKNKYLVWYTEQKKWYQKKTKKHMVVSFDSAFMKDKLSSEIASLAKNRIQYNICNNILINDIEGLGEFLEPSAVPPLPVGYITMPYKIVTTSPLILEPNSKKTNGYTLKDFL